MSKLSDFTAHISKDLKQPFMTIEFYKQEGDIAYSYRFKKGPDYKEVVLADDFILYCLVNTMRDIVEYNDNPADILESIQEIILQLGYELE